MYYEIKTGAGDHFEKVFDRAKGIVTLESFTGDYAQFDFNGITCVVGRDTIHELLFRDYCNAHTMEWTTIGPDCQENYSPQIQQELDRRNKLSEEKHRKQMAEYQKKVKKSKNAFLKRTAGVEIELSDADGFNDWKSKNQDGYGACIFEYAEGWAKLMQVEIEGGKTVKDCAEATSHQLDFLGITGFMYGAAVSILSKCWKYGEELRKWHNKEYGHEGEGVVNPAVLTIKA